MRGVRTAVAIATGLWLAGRAPAALAEPKATGGAVFAAHCAVCHGEKAGGVPGSFPPLQQQITAFAQTPAGRDYLVMAVSAGLIGELPVGGAIYRGVMPPQTMLSPAELAAALNYLASGLGATKPTARPFDAAEVEAIRTRYPGSSGQTARALRPVPVDK